MGSIPALVNRVLLRWARETAGLDVAAAARKLHRPDSDLMAWEEGTALPSIAQLREVARVYRRPSAVFFLSQVPPDVSVLPDLRTLSADRPRAFSSDLRFLIRSARERQRWLHDALVEAGEPPVKFVGALSMDSDAAEAARRVRSLLGVDDGPRRGSMRDALRRWIDAVEGSGVFVFQSGEVPVEEMRGFALPDAYAPVIGLNAGDAMAGRVFTVLHEFVHVMLGVEGVSDLVPIRPPRATAKPIEAYCNRVAAEVLAPAAVVEQAVQRGGRSAQADELIEELSRSLRVSREVVARRLLDLGYISKRAYLERRRRYQRAVEELEEEREQRGFVHPAQRAIRDNGRALTRLALSAYANEKIGGAELSRLLGVRLKHLPRMETAAFSASSAGAPL